MGWSEAAQSLGTILLAAGGSSRLGQPKQLVKFSGQPLVARQAELLLDLKPVTTVVVTGAGSEDVQQALSRLEVEFAHNEEWKQGMGRSLACGVDFMPERVRGVLVLLCDQWKIESTDLQQLIELWEANPQSAVAAHWETFTGPPVIFPRSAFARLARLRGDQGARQVLRRGSLSVLQVEMERAAFDLDVPDDLP